MKTKIILATIALSVVLISGCCRNPMIVNVNVEHVDPTPTASPEPTATATPTPQKADKFKDGPLAPGEGPASPTLHN